MEPAMMPLRYWSHCGERDMPGSSPGGRDSGAPSRPQRASLPPPFTWGTRWRAETLLASASSSLALRPQSFRGVLTAAAGGQAVSGLGTCAGPAGRALAVTAVSERLLLLALRHRTTRRQALLGTTAPERVSGSPGWVSGSSAGPSPWAEADTPRLRRGSPPASCEMGRLPPALPGLSPAQATSPVGCCYPAPSPAAPPPPPLEHRQPTTRVPALGWKAPTSAL